MFAGLHRLRRAVLVAVLGSAACCPDARTRAGSNTPLPTRDTVRPRTVLEPHPVLQLVRSERLSRNPPPAPAAPPSPRTDTQREPSTDEASEARDSADDEAEDEPASADVAEGEVRRIVVRRRRFATTADLIAAMVRHAEPRRPRELHGDRMILRASAAACHCDGDMTELARVQAAMRALVRSARPSLKRCLGEAIADDPRVIVKAPMTLVMTQAMLFGPIVHRFTPEFDIGPRGVQLRDLGWPDAPAELSTCLAHALDHARAADTSTIRAQHRVRLPLVAFSQRAETHQPRGIHWMLSLQAAAMGWLHYERGELDEALAYFEDAHWVFHEGEYLYLIGLAHERLGAPERAATAYERFLRERPYAPEAEPLRARIDALRRPQLAVAD